MIRVEQAECDCCVEVDGIVTRNDVYLPNDEVLLRELVMALCEYIDRKWGPDDAD